jgi:Tol biopolymer transport system component
MVTTKCLVDRSVPASRAIAMVLAFVSIAISPRCALARSFRYVTHEPATVDYWPRWSPDGSTILFSRCDITTGCAGGATTGYWRLYTVPAKGGTASEFLAIADVSATRSNWLWNTDSSIATPIAFTGVHHSGMGESGIYVIGADGSGLMRLPTSAGIPNGYPTWMPDGSAVAVEGSTMSSPNPFLDLVGVPDGDELEVQTDPDQIWTGQGAISRDGVMLAFAGQAPVAGSMYDDDFNQIWIQNLIPPNTDPNNFDTGLHQLDPLQGRTPDWSPNDRFLTFESRRGCLNGNYAIFIEASSTGEATQVTDCKLNANHAVWSPDGRRFAFSAEYFKPAKTCAPGCRGIAVAQIPHRILKLGTAP